MPTLKKRIFTEFGGEPTNAELNQSPTLRQQAELPREYTGYAQELPPGVLALRSRGTRKGIFWVHYLSVDLARAMGEDQPFFNVRLTAEDRGSFGKEPSLEQIAACLAGKIVATQSTGPYTIGGYCLGGMLAYEIACQLQATGEEVSHLLMLDTPSPLYFGSPRSLAPKLSHPLYLLKRAKKLGPRTTLIKLRESIFRHLTRVLKSHLSKTEIELAQEMIEAAVARYQPSKYAGKTVLLLASDHAPNINFLPGWKELLHDNLHAEYLTGHHSELTRKPTALSVANVMVSHLRATSELNTAHS
jgi:thioesterase domain-containing protein